MKNQMIATEVTETAADADVIVLNFNDLPDDMITEEELVARYGEAFAQWIMDRMLPNQLVPKAA